MECVCTRKHVEALREETTIADLTLCVGVNHHTPEEERERGEGGREKRRRGKREGEERGEWEMN